MNLPDCNSHRTELQSQGGPFKGLVMVLCAAVLLAGCEILPTWVFDTKAIPPLQYDGGIYYPDDALSEVEAPNVLAINAEMRDFVKTSTDGSHNSSNVLMALHRAIKSPDGLHMGYDSVAHGDAQATFERGSANCLSYAHMFIALAREAGLNAQYQWIEIRPEWGRIGERVAVRLHVNVQVKMRGGDEYMVDIDPLNRSEVVGSRVISDAEGLALHHNNLAMLALSDDELQQAWSHLVRGIEVAPGLSQLWVNMGAIYRHAGQYREAEQSYLHALEIDQHDRSAMNNLVVLYEAQGREEDSAYWNHRTRRYRLSNPYYHANLGDIAMDDGLWDTAYEHYLRAKKLQPRDGELLYSLGRAAHQRGDDDEALSLITEAIEHALYNGERERYRVELRSIEQQSAALL